MLFLFLFLNEAKRVSEKRKLLNEEQYHQEGIRQTRKALKELQTYCSSPECNPWKTVLKLKDPIRLQLVKYNITIYDNKMSKLAYGYESFRFARFMEGDSHLLEDEIDEHEEEISKILEKEEYTDDDDSF